MPRTAARSRGSGRGVFRTPARQFYRRPRPQLRRVATTSTVPAVVAPASGRYRMGRRGRVRQRLEPGAIG